jgi:hypothetical protein
MLKKKALEQAASVDANACGLNMVEFIERSDGMCWEDAAARFAAAAYGEPVPAG